MASEFDGGRGLPFFVGGGETNIVADSSNRFEVSAQISIFHQPQKSIPEIAGVHSLKLFATFWVPQTRGFPSL